MTKELNPEYATLGGLLLAPRTLQESTDGSALRTSSSALRG